MWWRVERMAAVIAIAGMLVAVLQGYHVRAWQDSGSDFKTLYASAWCFLHGQGAYNFQSIGAVFDADQVVRPFSWYAHSPIYPPFSFAALVPITLVPMAAAVWVWLVLSALSAVWAIWVMADVCESRFKLEWIWRLAIPVLVAASPLLSFSLEVGNVSALVGTLCVVAVMCDEDGSWWRASAMAFALLLKPHIVLWVLVGMLLSRNRVDRKLAVRALGIAAAVVVCFTAWVWLALPLGLQLREYGAIMRDEIAHGSLNPRNHELLPAVAQITSLESLIGYFFMAPWVQGVTAALLAGLAGTLVYTSRSKALDRGDTRLELLGAWSTFGLMPTYHRAHDGIILFLLVPWIVVRLARRWSDGAAWGVFTLAVAMAVSDSPPHYDWLAKIGFARLAEFLVFRQTACATALLLIVLLVDLVKQAEAGSSMEQQEPADEPSEVFANEY